MRGPREKLAFPGLVVTGSFELQVWVLWSQKERMSSSVPNHLQPYVIVQQVSGTAALQFNRDIIPILTQAQLGHQISFKYFVFCEILEVGFMDKKL